MFKKICFVSLNSYSLLANDKSEYVGGAEIQQVELAKELSKRGHEIYFIVYEDKKIINEKTMHGFKIIKAYDRGNIKNISIIKKLLILWSKMKNVDADIYIHRSGSPGVISLFGKMNEKNVIYQISSDSDITGDQIIQTSELLKFFKRMGKFIDFKLSDIVITQNDFQKRKLLEKYNIESVLIPNSFQLIPKINKNRNKSYILWVGTIRSVKQPLLFLELAKSFPNQKFIMIGGKGEDNELYEKIIESSKKINNLNFIGFVNRDKIFSYYEKSFFLVNTSKTEGFPNVFLEAWLHSIPVISLNIDPDGIISKYNLGYHSKSLETMKRNIKELITNEELRLKFGESGRDYLEKNHLVENAINKYESIFESFFESIPQKNKKN